MIRAALAVMCMTLARSFLSFPRSLFRSAPYSSLLASSGQCGGESSSSQFRPVLISIEGNIGAGKTTLLKRLRSKHPEWISIDEPVDTWSTIRNEQGESILEIFYKDRPRWSYTFQNCALLTRYQNIESAVSNARRKFKSGTFVFLTERCLETDRYVFTQMLRDEGSISKIEIDLYQRWLSELLKTSTPLSAIVHVNTRPENCISRIKQRGRAGEDAISADYLNKLNDYQSKWVSSSALPTLSTDGSDFERVEQFILDVCAAEESECK